MAGMRGYLVAALALWPGLAAAEPERTFVVDGLLGPAHLVQSRSHAPSHLFKPLLRVAVRTELIPRLEVGGAAIALLSPSAHYRILGGLGSARFAVIRGARFSLGPSAALGAGHDADILHADLSATARIAPYWLLAIDGRWQVGDRWLVGAEAGWHNAAVLYLGAVVGARLGGGTP